MKDKLILTSAAALAALSLAVTPAFAQHSRGSGGSQRSAGASAPRASARPSPQPSRSSNGSAPRVTSQSRGVYSSQPRGVYSNQSRGGYSYPSRSAYSSPSRNVYSSPSRGGYSYPSRGAYSYSSRYVTRGVYLAPSRFYRPYYTFRPRFSLGIGLWIGYPVVYSSPYYYGYPYPDYYGYPPPYDSYAPGYYPPSAYNYPGPGPSPAYPPANYPPNGAPQPGYYEGPPQGSVIARPGTASGSVSFEITPSTAEVYIEGRLMGRVSDLGPSTQPLALMPGRHHVEIRASGYETLSIDADVVAGQVIPYRGTMQPVR